MLSPFALVYASDGSRGCECYLVRIGGGTGWVRQVVHGEVLVGAGNWSSLSLSRLLVDDDEVHDAWWDVVLLEQLDAVE
jgi:hypothetical protein